MFNFQLREIFISLNRLEKKNNLKFDKTEKCCSRYKHMHDSKREQTKPQYR